MLRLLFLRKNRKWGTELITPESEENVNFNEHFFNNREKNHGIWQKTSKKPEGYKIIIEKCGTIVDGRTIKRV